jgi:hypothetical protein
MSLYIILMKNRDSSVDMSTGYGTDSWGSNPSRDKRLFSSPQRSDGLWGPPSFLSNGYCELFPRGMNRPERETDHLPPSSAEVKNGSVIPPLPNVFMVWCLINEAQGEPSLIPYSLDKTRGYMARTTVHPPLQHRLYHPTEQCYFRSRHKAIHTSLRKHRQ